MEVSPFTRYLKVIAQDSTGQGQADTVLYRNDGEFELILASDVDNDGRSNRTDRSRVMAMAKQFLKLGW